MPAWPYLLAAFGHIDEARGDFRQTITILKQLTARGLQDPRTLGDMADAWRLWESWNQPKGRPEQALAHAEHARVCTERAVKIAPQGVRYAWHLSLALESLAHQDELAKRAGDAMQLRRRVHQIWSDWDNLQPNTPYIQRQKRRAGGSCRPR